MGSYINLYLIIQSFEVTRFWKILETVHTFLCSIRMENILRPLTDTLLECFFCL